MKDIIVSSYLVLHLGNRYVILRATFVKKEDEEHLLLQLKPIYH